MNLHPDAALLFTKSDPTGKPDPTVLLSHIRDCINYTTGKIDIEKAKRQLQAAYPSAPERKFDSKTANPTSSAKAAAASSGMIFFANMILILRMMPMRKS